MASEAKLTEFDDLVRVELSSGKNLKSYSIYSSALTRRSIFFFKALSGSWKETEERAVRLPEDQVGIFELYLHHVYENKFACIPSSPDKQDTQAKNEIVKALINSFYKHRWGNHLRVPEFPFVHVIYKGTVEGSPLRRLLVDVFVRGLPSKCMKPELAKQYPGEFLQGLDVRLALPAPYENDGAAYLEK